MSSIAELKRTLDEGETTAVGLVTRTLDAIETAEGGRERLNAFLSLRRDLALAEAEAIDWERDEGFELGPLAGIPVAVKDNIAVAEGPTTAGSRILEGFVPPYDAGAIRRLKQAGAIVVGKTNLDEFAMGSSTENSAFGPTLNPHDRTRVPGGSSGGSTAAVAAGYVPAALGSDTGGSIRQPAAFCGVVGLKPTYGRVSRYGLVAFASSLDQIGPIASSVEDAAMLLSAIAGHDPQDATSADRPVPDYAGGLQRPLRGLRVGVPREYFADGLDPAVRAACDEALERLRAAGAQVRELSLPHTPEGIAAYYVVATAEASSNLARYDGVRYGHRTSDAADLLELYVRTRSEGFGAEVRRRIMLGTYVLSAGYYEAYYGRGRQVRNLIAADFDAAFDEVHCLLTPTTPTPAFPLGEKVDDPLSMYLADVYTVAVNLAGVPAVSVPLGGDPLPTGVQIIGPRWSEERLLNVAWNLENPGAETPGRAVRRERAREPELVGVAQAEGPPIAGQERPDVPARGARSRRPSRSAGGERGARPGGGQRGRRSRGASPRSTAAAEETGRRPARERDHAPDERGGDGPEPVGSPALDDDGARRRRRRGGRRGRGRRGGEGGGP